jgi:hypothetical protein
LSLNFAALVGFAGSDCGLVEAAEHSATGWAVQLRTGCMAMGPAVRRLGINIKTQRVLTRFHEVDSNLAGAPMVSSCGLKIE